MPPYLEASMLSARGLAETLNGDFDAAKVSVEKALSADPSWSGALLVAISAYTQSGDMDGAARFKERYDESSPGATMHGLGWRPQVAFAPNINAYFEGLKKSGFPER